MFGLGASAISSSVNAISGVIKEFIDTPEEKANANCQMLKTLDPNGIMRREITRVVALLYALYLIVMLVLTIAMAFGLSATTEIFIESIDGIDKFRRINSADYARAGLTSIFLEVSASFTMIVSASFGVNYTNIKKLKN